MKYRTFKKYKNISAKRHELQTDLAFDDSLNSEHLIKKIKKLDKQYEKFNKNPEYLRWLYRAMDNRKLLK